MKEPNNQDEELSLIDVCLFFYRNRKVILMTFIICFWFAVAYILLQKTEYSYTTILEIGTITSSKDGKPTPINTAGKVRSKLKHLFIPFATREHRAKHKYEGSISVSATSPKNSELVFLEVTGKEDKEELYKSLTADILGRVLEDHKQQIAALGEVISVQPSRIKNTRVITKPIKSIKSVFKKNVTIIFASSIAGLLLGVMTALAAELIRETGKRVKEDKPDA